MKSVLVTHADLPLGRRIAKVLWHDARVDRIVALGEGGMPRAFAGWRSGAAARLVYERVDLARQRAVSELFRSKRMRVLTIDSVVHVPPHGAAQDGPPLAGRVAPRTAEARHLLHFASESRTIRRLVAIGSAFVYRLAPGNANHLTEASPLDLEPDVDALRRAWIDCDMLFHAAAAGTRLQVALLRVPTVVASGGYVYLHPGLEGAAGVRLRPLGFDPLCPVIADKDVALAVRAALACDRTGVFNVAGRDAVPLSVLGRWTGRPCLPVPGALLRGASAGPQLRYGMSLDTRRAAEQLGFEPRYRVGVARAGDGALRLEAVAS
ncbi:MAG: hypothetical protein DCC71_13405 [Proteobacteria bacterium]|nr:MAG: hypothetical protein DCC71_13405 [Pseudomonadota bacterium]